MKKFALSLPVLLVLLFSTGCKTDLQADYVTAMEDAYSFVQLDVKSGAYKLDEKSTNVLKAWNEANTKARAALSKKEEAK
jgi:hypothetical protein